MTQQELDFVGYKDLQSTQHSTNFEAKIAYKVNQLVIDLGNEATADAIIQMAKWPKFNSAHEGFAVLYEEVDELWEEVRLKQTKRSVENMRKEALQVAAMAIRFAAEICNEQDIRK